MIRLNAPQGPEQPRGPTNWPAGADARPRSAARIERLMTSLLRWIASETGHLVLQLPAVTLSPRPVLSSLSPLSPHNLARYVRGTGPLGLGQIELALDWHDTDPIHQSVLLHALIRHVQARTPAAGRSAAIRDAEAYVLQALWLDQRGIDFRLTFGISPALIARLRLDA